MENPKRRQGRPQIPLLSRLTPNLSVPPDPSNRDVCWLWTGPLIRRAGGQVLQKVHKDGVLVNIYPRKKRDTFAVPSVSRAGKLDTTIRQLYREFIGEPPPRGTKTCGVFLCCNPWHWGTAATYTRPQLHAEVVAAQPLPEPPPADDIQDLIEMMSEHWLRDPSACLDVFFDKFGADYEPDDIREAACLAIDACPPGIRATVLSQAGT